MHTPLYDIDKTYLENAEKGPFFKGTIPSRKWPDKKEWIDFLGFPLASRIGVPAGPLLNSRWIGLASELGYDLLFYKTIRSRAHPGHPLPNIIFLNEPKQLSPTSLPPTLTKSVTVPDYNVLAITNSFGMPSRDPHYLLNDIPLANSLVKKGQVVVVSIVGSGTGPHFLQDFVQASSLAKDCGAHIIEANFSCPNVTGSEGSLYEDPQAVFDISSAIIKAIRPIPLILKFGLFPSLSTMRKTFIEAARAGVQAVAGINTISMKVTDVNGNPALGPGRLTSGVCGAPIRDAALDFVRDSRSIIDKEKLDLTLLGCGGILLPEHFTAFLEAGADFALTATGMMWDPYLAMKYHTGKVQNYDQPRTHLEAARNSSR